MRLTKYGRMAGPSQHARLCEHCGHPVPHTRRGRPRRYCSQACRTAAWARRKDATPEPLPEISEAISAVLNSPTATTEVLAGLTAQLRSGERSGAASNDLIRALFGAYDAAISQAVTANPIGQTPSPSDGSSL